MSDKVTRRSGEKDPLRKKIKVTARPLDPLKTHHHSAIGSLDLQSHRLDRATNDLALNFEAANEDARKILKEAAIAAEKKRDSTKI